MESSVVFSAAWNPLCIKSCQWEYVHRKLPCSTEQAESITRMQHCEGTTPEHCEVQKIRGFGDNSCYQYKLGDKRIEPHLECFIWIWTPTGETRTWQSTRLGQSEPLRGCAALWQGGWGTVVVLLNLKPIDSSMLTAKPIPAAAVPASPLLQYGQIKCSPASLCPHCFHTVMWNG